MFHKKVVRDINHALVIKYVLPKREIAKICVAVVLTEMLLHAPVRKELLNKIENKIDHWAGTPDTTETGTRQTLRGVDDE